MECKFKIKLLMKFGGSYIKVEPYWNVNASFNAILMALCSIKVEPYWNVNGFRVYTVPYLAKLKQNHIGM